MSTELTETQTRNWDLLFAESDYIVLQEFLNTLKKGNIEELGSAMEKYISKIKQREERELCYNLRDLMQYILLWNYSDKYKISEYEGKILDLRSEIDMALETEGCLSSDTIKLNWVSTFEKAKSRAANFEKEIICCNELTWNEVFNKSYSLLNVEN